MSLSPPVRIALKGWGLCLLAVVWIALSAWLHSPSAEEISKALGYFSPVAFVLGVGSLLVGFKILREPERATQPFWPLSPAEARAVKTLFNVVAAVMFMGALAAMMGDPGGDREERQRILRANQLASELLLAGGALLMFGGRWLVRASCRRELPVAAPSLEATGLDE